MATGRSANRSRAQCTVPQHFGQVTFLDLSGPHRPAGLGKARFKLMFVDSATHYRTLAVIESKNHAVDEIKTYFARFVFPVKVAKAFIWCSVWRAEWPFYRFFATT